MNKLEATFRIVTPMFCGGADIEGKAELRTPSIKSAIRFWWRALNWGPISQKQSTEENALKQLRQEEGRLFGCSTGDHPGQGKFLIRVKASESEFNLVDEWPKNDRKSGYIGQGLWESGSTEKENFKPHRKGIEENVPFHMTFLFNPDTEKEDITAVADAVKAFGLLGGLGSRSRRAFGSVAAEKINDQEMKFCSLDEYSKAITELIKGRNLNSKYPPFSAFSQQAGVAISSSTKATARTMHAELGGMFENYRGNSSPMRGPKKRVFGMPIKVGRKEEKARRASPLFFHIHPVGTEYTGMIVFLPAFFHPDPDLGKVDFKIAKSFLDQSQFEKVSLA